MTGHEGTDGPQATLGLAHLDHRPPRVAVTPGPTLFTLAADVAGAGRGSPPEWIEAARAQLEPVDLEVLAPIGVKWGGFCPGCVSTIGGACGDAGVAEELERIATLPTEQLLEDIAFASGPTPAPPWQRVARRPRRWLVLYARALGRIWNVIREPWAAASALFERELERVETAAARGALPELLDGLHHRAWVSDGAWRMVNDEPIELRPPEDGLTITPLLAGPGSARANFTDDGVLEGVGYPLPGVLRVLSGELLTPAAALESLLGEQRVRILRLLEGPRTAGEIASALGTSPATVTYQLRALESAGLVLRERDGRQVVVHRTARGTGLLGLYGAA